MPALNSSRIITSFFFILALGGSILVPRFLFSFRVLSVQHLVTSEGWFINHTSPQKTNCTPSELAEAGFCDRCIPGVIHMILRNSPSQPITNILLMLSWMFMVAAIRFKRLRYRVYFWLASVSLRGTATWLLLCKEIQYGKELGRAYANAEYGMSWGVTEVAARAHKVTGVDCLTQRPAGVRINYRTTVGSTPKFP